MPWIEQIPIKKSTGLLKKLFDEAIERAGRVWNLVHIMSQNPQTLKTSMAFYVTIMKGQSPLSRVQREMLATVVSSELNCHYWTQAHAHDLREEVGKLMVDQKKADDFVHAIAKDWRSAPLTATDRALCQFAAKLTHLPRSMSKADIDALREFELDDRAIHDAVQVIGYFNYITRVADSLGVEPETFIKPWGGK